MRQFTIVIFMAVLSLLLLAGCQESDSNQIRRARLVANENLELKQDLEEKDQQIEELKKQIEKIEIESAEKVEKAGETSIKSMRLLLKSEQRAEGILIENRKLKKELEKLKASN